MRFRGPSAEWCLRQLGVEGEVPGNCCSPFHWRNRNKSLFVTLLERRTKALGTFEPLWLRIWRKNCSGMGKAARRAELCVPSIFMQQGLMTTFKARKVINWKISFLFFLLVCLSAMQGWLSYQFLVLLFYWAKVSFNYFFLMIALASSFLFLEETCWLVTYSDAFAFLVVVLLCVFAFSANNPGPGSALFPLFLTALSFHNHFSLCGGHLSKGGRKE